MAIVGPTVETSSGQQTVRSSLLQIVGGLLRIVPFRISSLTDLQLIIRVQIPKSLLFLIMQLDPRYKKIR